MINRIFSIAVLVLLSMAAMAQSGDHVMHEVKAGETKYGISREYNISIERLEKFNPDIKAGLKVGMTLLIPPPKEDPDSVKQGEEEAEEGFVNHEVKAGETLFSLSRTYGAAQQEIRRHNPQLEEGLKTGMVLQIPVSEVDGEKADAEPEGDFCYHEVKPKETAWAISKYYELSLDSLYLLNPEAEAGLQIGQVLKIPPSRCREELEKEKEQEKEQEERESQEDETDIEESEEAQAIADTTGGYLLYRIKTGDSFYSLKQRFQVDREELLALNPEISDGLKVDKYIIIPQKRERRDMKFIERLFKKVEDEGPRTVPTWDQINLRDSLNLSETPVVQKPINEDTLDVDISKTYRVAVMLPFYAVKDTSFNYEQRIEKRSTYALDFYNGLLMAADSLAKEGMNINLNLIDTENSLFKVKKKMPEVKRAQYDLVVGPLYKKNVELVAEELEDEMIPVLSPLSSTVELDGHPNLVKCIPGTTANVERIAYLLNNDHKEAKVILVNFLETDGTNNRQEMMQIKARLQPRSKDDFVEAITVGEDEMSFELVEEAIADSSQNVVVALSDDKVFLSGLISSLRSKNKGETEISLIGNSKLMDMQTVDIDYLNDFNFTMPDVSFINYGGRETVNFIAEYRDRFKGEPSRYAFQGYDVGMYFLRKLWKTGPFFLQAIQESQPMLSTGFEMKKTEDGGYENSFLHLTRIKDYELVKVNPEVEVELKEVEK